MDAITNDLARSAMPGPEEREMVRLEKAARDFESLVLETLLKEMRPGAPGGDSSSDPASETLDSFGVTALSGVMSKTGGFGLAEVLVQAMEAQVRAIATQNDGGA
jgi:Rod binding domain-containing protein